MNRALVSVVLVVFTLMLTRATTGGDCDVSACIKEIEWPTGGNGPNGSYGIYDQISTCANISNNGFFSQQAWLIVRYIGPDDKEYKPNEDEYFILPDVGTSRIDCSIWSALSVGLNGTSMAPDGWYDESIQLKLPSGEILDQENKAHAFQIVS